MAQVTNGHDRTALSGKLDVSPGLGSVLVLRADGTSITNSYGYFQDFSIATSGCNSGDRGFIFDNDDSKK